MPGDVAQLVERLCEADSPRERSNWAQQDGYYITTCRVSSADVPGLIDVVQKWYEPDWAEDRQLPLDPDQVELLPVTAWRTLADLKSDEAVQPLIDILSELESEEDEWVLEEFPKVFGKIGEVTIEPLLAIAQDESFPQFIRTAAASGLRHVAEYHPHTRDRIVALLTESMSSAHVDDIEFNSTLMSDLVDLNAVEAAEPIERAFSRDLLDVGVMGGWSEVRRILGVEGLNLPMPANPYNSIVIFRHQAGLGIFSERPVFGIGEVDNDAEEAYYQQAGRVFSESPEGQQAIERDGDLHWVDSFLRYGVQYQGEVVDAMGQGTLEDYVFDYLPAKVTTESTNAPTIIASLASFWTFIDRVYALPEAKSIVQWLQTEGLAARLEKEMSDPAHFGMAKSFFIAGTEAGFDMTSPGDIERFVAKMNKWVVEKPAMPVISGQPHVGRNEPCPCGSGKKYKKCCGHPSRR